MLVCAFISVDALSVTRPEGVGRSFTEVMHPDMIGLTGSGRAGCAAAQVRPNRTLYNIARIADASFYLVDHSNLTYLVFPPEIGFVDFFAVMHRRANGRRVGCFIDAT